MIYTLSFLISVFFLYLAENYNDEHFKRRRYIILSALVIILISTIRDPSVGRDVASYQIPLYNCANKANSIISYYHNPYVVQFEPGYTFIIFLSSLFNSLAIAFLFETTIIVVFIYLTVLFYSDTVPAYLSLACFEFIFFLYGFNLNRQSIAIVMCMYAVVQLEKNKPWISILLVLTAILFHRTAVVGFGILLLSYLSRKRRKYLTILLAICTTSISVFYGQISMYLVSVVPFFRRRYMWIISKNEGGNGILWSEVFYVLLNLIVLLFIYISGHENKSKNYKFLLYMMILSICSATVGSQTSVGKRIFMYPEIFSIFVIPQIRFLIVPNKANRIIADSIVVVISFVFFFFSFYMRNYGDVFPYTVLGVNLF